MHQFQIGRDITEAEMTNMVAFLNALTGEYNGKLLQ